VFEPKENMDKLQQIIHERPSFHRSETEIDRSFDPSESLLPREAAAKLASVELTCYGLGSDVLSFIAESVSEGSQTLETGAGCSTLVFAMRGSEHIAITPSKSEIALITQYALQREIPLGKVHFVQESSDRYLGRCEVEGLDLVLLDGKHAFPWPIVDWFFTADRLREGGMMVIDDAQMRSVAILAEFMGVDPGWQLIRDFSGKTLAFRKLRDSIHDVTWHMQPFTVVQPVGTALGPSLLRRLARRLKRLVQGQR
jgi:predicted O-methyltransferase YrrM